jgi:hypothetical protein
MAAMSTVLKLHNTGNNLRIWTAPGHSVLKPVTVEQRRTEATSPDGTNVDKVICRQGVVDAAGAMLPEPFAIDVTARRPVSAVQADIDANIALFRDFVASDEFVDMINAQAFIAE